MSQTIIWLLTSLWRHFKWDRHQIWTQLWLGIQEDVCKVSLLYLFALRRYLRRSKGGQLYGLCPPAAGGWRGGPAAAGLRMTIPTQRLSRIFLIHDLDTCQFCDGLVIRQLEIFWLSLFLSLFTQHTQRRAVYTYLPIGDDEKFRWFLPVISATCISGHYDVIKGHEQCLSNSFWLWSVSDFKPTGLSFNRFDESTDMQWPFRVGLWPGPGVDFKVDFSRSSHASRLDKWNTMV